MKRLMNYLLLLTFLMGGMISQLDAKSKKDIVLPEKVQTRVETKTEETLSKLERELSLSEKQYRKIYDLKLKEAVAIESKRMDKTLSQHDVKNTIILIKEESAKKISKVLKRDQKVLWEVKKENYVYNPGFWENMKDVYKQTKENLQEKLGWE